MFTGIIEEVGKVRSITEIGDSFRIAVNSISVSAGVCAGDSVAVNGICLTVTDVDGSSHFVCDAVKETVTRTTVSTLRAGIEVNLERALTPESRLGGHIVQGHVDGVASVSRMDKQRAGMEMHIQYEKDYAKYLVRKGSVCIDGVSLTIAEIDKKSFRVALVPYTLKNTTLGDKKAGDRVNIETDIIGRYVERMLEEKGGSEKGISKEGIFTKGFGRKK